MKYSDAGVDIDKAERAMNNIKGMVKSTYTPEVCADFGNFGGLFSLMNLNMEEPILVSSIDGVGTKLKIAIALKKYACPGIDIVNHCVNDILVQGARPLFFLDYFASGVLDGEVLAGVISGIVHACKENQCALLGGETAEMPGLYHAEDFDLAGCIVGVVDRKNLIDGSRVCPGDIVIGIKSSGLHTNGFSLARKVLFDKAELKMSESPPGLTRSIGDDLIEPHRSYFNCLYPLVPKNIIKAMAHITGGGFKGNIPRILPDGVGVCLDLDTWEVPGIFKLIQEKGNVERDEMYRTFNMGIGMIVIVDPASISLTTSTIRSKGEDAVIIGKVFESKGAKEVKFESKNTPTNE